MYFVFYVKLPFADWKIVNNFTFTNKKNLIILLKYLFCFIKSTLVKEYLACSKSYPRLIFFLFFLVEIHFYV